MIYKALVADDEYIIRKGIVSFLKKYDNIEVVAEAEDGEMALEYAKNTRLDILFVDVNMPFLNGLQFIEQLKIIQPNAVVIVITGYDNFEYVRQALRLGVNEYILKPLMEDVFDRSIDKVIEKIEKKNEEVKYLNWAKTMLKENRAHLIKDFIYKWVEGHYSKEEVLDKMDYLSIYIPKPFAITLISLEHIENSETDDKWNDDLLYYAAENIVKEIFEELSPTYTCKNSHGNIVLISQLTEKEDLIQLNSNCCENIEKYIPAKVILLQGSGKEYDEMSYLYQTLLDNMEVIIECPSVIKRVKKYIEQNYSKEDFSLLEAADYMNLSPQHLSRLFKKEMGITFVDYLTRVRTRKAIELLYQYDMKMYEIAEKVGYSSQHYFSSVFKKEMGMSPIDYRKNCNKQRGK